MVKETDVLIAGGGPVGTYLARLLGSAGLDVVVCEKRNQEDMGHEIGYIHFDVRYYLQLHIPRPPQKSGIVIRSFDDMWQVPMTENMKFPVEYPTHMLKYPRFIRYLHKWAEETGKVSFYFDSPVEEVVLNKNVPAGFIVKGLGEVRAPLVVDATGRVAFVRNMLPASAEISPLKTRNERMFTVYMEEWECEGAFPEGSNTYVSFKGFCNQLADNTVLVGASTLKGREGSVAMHKKMVRHHLRDVKYKILNRFCSDVPYDFPPSSLVSDSFLSVGDAAFLNKPFNGEGIGSGMEASCLAAEVIIDAHRVKDFSKLRLWPYNYNYFRGVGADFALIRGTGEYLVEMSEEDFDWIYKAGFITPEDMSQTWNDYRVNKDVASLLKTAFQGMENTVAFGSVLKGLMLGALLSLLFKTYPRSSSDFPGWKRRWDIIRKNFIE